MAKLVVQQDAGGFKLEKGKKLKLVITDSNISVTELVKTGCFKKEPVELTMPISDILFFDYKAKAFGLLGYKLHFGGTVAFKYKSLLFGLKKNLVLDIRQWLMDHGAKFASKTSEGKVFKPTGIHPIRKELIALTDTEIIHTVKTKFRNRDSVLPFDKVDFFILEKSGCCKYRFVMVGAVSFATEGKFSTGVKEEVRQALEAKALKPSEGKVYHPNFFSGVKGRRKMSLILLEDKIVYVGPKYGQTSDGQTKETGIMACAVRHVTSYKCKPIFSLFKREAVITGTGVEDLRTNDVHEYVIDFPGVFFFSWFSLFCCCCGCGKIKKACRALR